MSMGVKTVRLSPRLESIAALVTPGNRVADIGTDHAYLPVFLCQKEIIPSAVASDLRTGPLEAAAFHIRQAGLEDRIETRLSDGLADFCDGEAETLILAGMGGKLICRILGQKPELVKHFREILLQPQSDVGEVRRFLTRHAFRIENETCTEDEGKFYPVIRSVPSSEQTENGDGGYGSPVVSVPHGELTDAELEFGPCLLESKNPLLKSWLTRRLIRTETILTDLCGRKSESSTRRYEELKEEEQLLKTALAFYEM